jgi:hypothetical protein
LRESNFLQLPDGAEQLALNVRLLPDYHQNAYLLLSRLAQKYATATRKLPFSLGSDWQPLSTPP